jgi:L-malate glycosyltransferase
MVKIAIVYRVIPHYRRRFYELLKERLAGNGIELELIYGQPSRRDAMKRDTVDIRWATKISNRVFEIGGRELYWQPVLNYLKDVNLVIVEQATKLLVNYVLLLYQSFGICKLAFWGHGKNLQEISANLLAEKIKRMVSTRVHWWFAYNELSASIVRDLGFPSERITSVQNAIDTRNLINALSKLSAGDVGRVRRELGIEGTNVGIYAGGMYFEKRLPFLFEALRLVRRKISDFEMIFIGSGVDAEIVRKAADEYHWIHYVGPKFEEEKVPYFAASKLFLMPGLVGLGILDAFALETPLITTRLPIHSPEIDYLQNGYNGVMVDEPEDPAAYAQKVSYFLQNETARQKLVDGCRIARDVYTLESMVDKFYDGILNAIA